VQPSAHVVTPWALPAAENNRNLERSGGTCLGGAGGRRVGRVTAVTKPWVGAVSGCFAGVVLESAGAAIEEKSMSGCR